MIIYLISPPLSSISVNISSITSLILFLPTIQIFFLVKKYSLILLFYSTIFTIILKGEIRCERVKMKKKKMMIWTKQNKLCCCLVCVAPSSEIPLATLKSHRGVAKNNYLGGCSRDILNIIHNSIEYKINEHENL